MRKQIDPARIERAHKILALIARRKQRSIEQLQSKLNKGRLPYARQLAVYNILSETQLPYELIAEMFGPGRKRNFVHYCHEKIKSLAKVDERVKREVIQIQKQIKKAA